MKKSISVLIAIVGWSGLALAADTTVSLDITFEIDTHGPAYCDGVINGTFSETYSIHLGTTGADAEVNGVYLALNANGLPEPSGTAVSMLNVDGDTATRGMGSANGVQANVFVSEIRDGYTSTQQPVTSYDLGSDNGVISGAIRMSGSFPDGVRFSFLRGQSSSQMQSQMLCYGHGSVELSFTGTLTQL